ncbi:MAG TPA: 5'-3' exonuclease H3TH domain-containing protein [Kiritimatiellia bacterium]|nr:5'-3' exonuclease H3TH domain-containing protein [Kiritimatiellia bacterium]HSA19341.1 5'-3' exonuclease H3TH domain-containing protein [Kiritimatiellia bacterium]
MSNPVFLLVDGLAAVYRAFHAIPELTARDGRPTNALFGFIRMLQQLEQRWRPAYELVVFDGGLPEERMARLPTYKAQRPPMPEPLHAQLEPIGAYLSAAGRAGLRVPGQEADDVIATLSARAVERGMDVLIATGDKDLFQLIDERVGMVALSKSEEKIGAAQVMEKTGVPPALVVDWLALTGDSVDNIPGLPGVGPKTASRWLLQYGSLEKLLERRAEIGNPRFRAALESGMEIVRRNVELMKLRRDLPVEFDGAAWRVRPSDPSVLLRFYEKMDLESLARPLRPAEPAPGQGMLDFGGG